MKVDTKTVYCSNDGNELMTVTGEQISFSVFEITLDQAADLEDALVHARREILKRRDEAVRA